MKALDRMIAELVTAFAARAERDELLRNLVLQRFEPTGSRRDRSARKDVYEHVASGLRVVLNNDRCNEIRAAVLSLPGVYCTTGGNRKWFRGLRPRS